MGRIVSNRRLRFLLLRVSSLQLASVLLVALAIIFISFWADDNQPAWFILLASMLMLATLAVLMRLGPVMWRDLSRYRKLRRISRIQSLPNHVAWRFKQVQENLIEQVREQLSGQQYAVLETQQDGLTVISAMKGRLNRIGFILTHAAILIIFLGAVLDSDLLLRYQLNMGGLSGASPTTPLNEMGQQSRIPARSKLAFQGQEQLLSGQITDEVRVMTEQGAVVKHLPFAVAIHGVELDVGHNLQEDNFLTRISILDPRLNEPVRAILGSNRPFRYRGLDYYQAEVVDGGSELTVSMWPLSHSRSVPLKFRTLVGTERQLQTRDGTINISFVDLKPRNILRLQSDMTPQPEYKSIGPSLFYSVNDESGSERQFINYMLPVLQDGRYFFISGYRHNADESFTYMHIPVDKDGSLERFIQLHAVLYDQQKIQWAIDKVLSDAGKTEKTQERVEFKKTLTELISLFRGGGFVAINKNIANRVTQQSYQQSTQLSYKLVRSLIYALYKQGLGTKIVDETDLLFFEDALPVLAKLANTEMPFYIQLQDMHYKPAVKLLVSYKPGSVLFFGGWILLLTGLALTFFTYYRRVWVVFDTEGEFTNVSVTGMSSRHRLQFTREFNRLFTRLQNCLGTCRL